LFGLFLIDYAKNLIGCCASPGLDTVHAPQNGVAAPALRFSIERFRLGTIHA
jgi:hypothetical protein